MSIDRGYLLPHAPVFVASVGGEQIRFVEKSIDAYKVVAAEIAEIKPELIIVISPHGPVFTDAIALYDLDDYSGDFNSFGDFNSKYCFEKDEVMLNDIYEESQRLGGRFYKLKKSEFKKFQFKPELDHGVLVPLHFIIEKYKSFELVAMSYGTLSYSELLRNGEIIQSAIERSNKKVVIIASGDMSHALKSEGPYKYHKDGVLFDQAMCENIVNQESYEILRLDNKTISNAAECGLRSLAIMLGSMNHFKIKSELISYEAPFGVGYLFARYNILSKSNNDEIKAYETYEKYLFQKQRLNEHELVKIARQTIEYYVKERKIPKTKYIHQSIIINDVSYQGEIVERLLNGRFGVFVSIKRFGNLRGCIGTILPTQKNGIVEIMNNAISSCSKDYRFDPLEEDELQDIIINVDVLSPLNIVSDRAKLDPKKYGVIVTCKDQMGVLLPDLDGISTIEEQLTVASNKGGFHVDDIEKVESFTVERYF